MLTYLDKDNRFGVTMFLMKIIFIFVFTSFAFTVFSDEKVACEKSERENEHFFNEAMGRVVSRTYVDINNDGRKEVLIDRHVGGNWFPPEYFIEFFDENCNSTEVALEKFWGVWSGWDTIEFSINNHIVTLTAMNLGEGVEYTKLNESKAIYQFNGKEIILVSEEKAKEIDASIDLRSSFFSGRRLVEEDERIGIIVDLNNDNELEKISCGYWARWGRLTGCKIENSNKENILDVDQGAFHPKRIGILPEKKNGWHVIVVDFNERLTYQPAPINGYQEVSED